MRTCRIVFLCLAAFAFGEGREPPCAFGYCMGQAMKGEADAVNPSDGLLVTYSKADADSDGVYVHWAPIAGVCAVLVRFNSTSPFELAKRFAADYAKKIGEPTLRTESVTMWTQPARGIKLFGVTAGSDKVLLSFQFANHDACLEEVQG